MLQVHLKVDTNLTDKAFQVKAYGSKPLGLGDKTLASEFIEMPTEVQFSEAEKIAGASVISRAARPCADSVTQP